MEDIPRDFPGKRHWVDVQQRWFFAGLDARELRAKPGIDKRKALTHLSACQQSFEPRHEHKEAGVAYLMSLWFEAP